MSIYIEIFLVENQVSMDISRSRSRSRGRSRAIRRAGHGTSVSRSISRSRSFRAAAAVVARRKMRGIGDTRNKHSFRRMCAAEVIDVTGVAYTAGMEFKLSDLPGVTEMSDLYDRYKLTTVVLKFRIINNPDVATSLNAGVGDVNTATLLNSTNWYPRLFYCKDYDDSTAESLGALRERAKTKMIVLKPNKYYKIVVKPAVTVQTYRTVSTTGYSPSWNQWIDMAQNNVPYYGLKYVVDCSGVTPQATRPFKLEIEKQYFFTCKDVR